MGNFFKNWKFTKKGETDPYFVWKLGIEMMVFPPGQTGYKLCRTPPLQKGVAIAELEIKWFSQWIQIWSEDHSDLGTAFMLLQSSYALVECYNASAIKNPVGLNSTQLQDWGVSK